MTTHEMILLCSSLQGVGRCIPLCLLLGFATFSASVEGFQGLFRVVGPSGLLLILWSFYMGWGVRSHLAGSFAGAWDAEGRSLSQDARHEP